MQEFDVLVIGGGASGLRTAIAAKRAGASVGLISKVHPLRTNSAIAQGGLNAPLGQDDSPEKFAADTIIAGDDLCNREVVKAFSEEAAKEVIWLERMGVPFNRDTEGRLDFRAFGSNGRNRTCYADDRTGHIVLQVLHEQFQREQIPSFEEWFVTSLVVEDGACVGAIALSLRNGKLDSFPARSVVLATGGFTRAYLPSTASFGTTGDGQSLAYEAGARLMDATAAPGVKEAVDFYRARGFTLLTVATSYPFEWSTDHERRRLHGEVSGINPTRDSPYPECQALPGGTTIVLSIR
jgi:succinate dehydrogenase / fumarate reductase, flavoprotein subunit